MPSDFLFFLIGVMVRVSFYIESLVFPSDLAQPSDSDCSRFLALHQIACFLRLSLNCRPALRLPSSTRSESLVFYKTFMKLSATGIRNHWKNYEIACFSWRFARGEQCTLRPRSRFLVNRLLFLAIYIALYFPRFA